MREREKKQKRATARANHCSTLSTTRRRKKKEKITRWGAAAAADGIWRHCNFCGGYSTVPYPKKEEEGRRKEGVVA